MDEHFLPKELLKVPLETMRCHGFDVYDIGLFNPKTSGYEVPRVFGWSFQLMFFFMFATTNMMNMPI